MNNKPAFDDISDLEIDVLLLYYQFSDQWGRVDTISAANFAASKYGIVLHQKSFQLSQQHMDTLMDRGVIVDTRDLFKKVEMMELPKRKRRKNGKSSS